jgi:hypothetical protein
MGIESAAMTADGLYTDRCDVTTYLVAAHDVTTLENLKGVVFTMDKLQLRGQNLGRVYSSKSDCMSAMHLFCYEAKQLNLKLKTRPKQLLGSLLLAFALPVFTFSSQFTNGADKLECF